MLRLTVPHILALVLSVAAWAQSPFQVIEITGQPRNAALAPTTKFAYLAIYDAGEVWRIDTSSHDTLGKVPVGKGPASLALSHDGKTLACVNRLANNLTLLKTPELTVIATVPCGNGATSVTALGDDQFAVANAFADSVTVVALGDPQHPRTIEGVTSVPTDIAAFGAVMAVATRSPAAVLVYSADTDKPGKTIALPDAPVSLAAVNEHVFVVATRTRLLLLDGVTGKITAEKNITALDVATVTDKIAVLTEASVSMFSPTLEAVEQFPVSIPGRSLSVTTDRILIVSPAAKTWQVAEMPNSVAQTAGVPAAPPSEKIAVPEPSKPAAIPEPAPAVSESIPKPKAKPQETTPESAPATPQKAEPKPEEKRQEPAPESAVSSAPAPEQAKAQETPKQAATAVTPETPAAPEAIAQPKPEHVKVKEPPKVIANSPEGRALRSPSLGYGEPKAPEPQTFKPSPFLVGPISEKKVAQQMAGKPDMGSAEGGFTVPDWAQDAQYTAEVMDADREKIHLTGNSQIQLDNMHIASDEFMMYKLTNEMEATGNVVVTQELSSLTAIHLKYKLPDQTEEAPPNSPLALTSEEQNRLKLHSGLIDGENAHLIEPTREIYADTVHYDLAAQTGELTNAKGRMGQFYFNGQLLRILGPASADGEDVWVTTCDHDPPHYQLRMKKASLKEGEVVEGTSAQLQLGGKDTPLYWPKWSSQVGGADTAGFDFRSGHMAKLGYFIDFGQQFSVTDNVNLGYRLMPTSNVGIGVGVDAKYDYMETPISPLFRSKGEFHSLYTTEDRGYWELYHRQEIWDDTVLLLQSEQWSDPTFYKDFFYDKYKQRTEPRTFANLTYTQPTYLATATLRQTTNNFVAETERAPEFTYHLLERPVLEHLYFSFDSVDGYNEREPAGTHALRLANVGRLTYDWNMSEGWNLTPFYEAEATWYSDDTEEHSDLRFSNELGATLQTRLHKEYPGAWGFSGFKNVIVPSVTYSYRPESNMDVEKTPRFDALDNVYGHSRLESKIDSLLFGRDAQTGETWQVGRLTLYQGNDLWNELRKSQDYTIEMDVRPRQYLGTQMAWEHHEIQRHFDIDDPYLVQQVALQVYENVTGHPYDPEIEYRYNARYGDYNRFLSYVYFDDRPRGGNANGRVGFAYTETQGKVFNREILYGMGYRLNDKWSASFEHRYDLERDKLKLQVYELRRDLHCWEASIQMRERESGWDINVAFNIKAFPGSRVKF